MDLLLLRALEASDDAVIVRSPEGLITYANLAAVTWLGASPTGLTVARAFERASMHDGHGATLSAESLFEPTTLRTIHATTHAGERWLRVRCLAGVPETPTARVLILRDETALHRERARADAGERSLTASESSVEHGRRDAQRLRVLSEASRVFAEAGLDLRAAFQTVVHYVADVTGDGCLLCLRSEDGAHLETVATHHPDERVRELITALFARDFRVDEGLPGMVARTGRSLLIPRFDPITVPPDVRPETRAYFAEAPPHSILIVPLRVRDRVIGTLGVTRDRPGPSYTGDDERLLQEIGDRAALLLENARLFDAAQRAIRARDDFLSIAAHELRTPLTTLQLHVQSAARAARRESVQMPIASTLEAADRQVVRLTRLTENLLDVARITLGRLELNREPVDLSDLVHEVVQRHRDDAARAGCEVSLTLAPDVRGNWDRLRLEQVVTNLFANAIKYGKGAPVSVQTRVAEGGCVLTVRDNGIGIALEQQARIFERFERAVSSRSYGGLGLGLFITRQIVESHGGTVSVDSAPGLGAAFTVELPTE